LIIANDIRFAVSFMTQRVILTCIVIQLIALCYINNHVLPGRIFLIIANDIRFAVSFMTQRVILTCIVIQLIALCYINNHVLPGLIMPEFN
jgi:hypothetical protein